MTDRTVPTLVMGSKNYSSWSLRPWLFLRKMGFEFKEQIIAFDAPDYQAQIAAASPSKRVPVLLSGNNVIWDSLAICEHVADVKQRGWPENILARAFARSAAAEMHSGFAVLREAYPMNVRGRGRRVPQNAELAKEIARIDEVWSLCRQRFGGGGPWLFGEFSIADAMYAPVWFRFQTYGASLSGQAQGYLEHALADATLKEWQDACQIEKHVLSDVDAVGRV
jgi:glutathione S-transferase